MESSPNPPVAVDRRRVDFGALTLEARDAYLDEILDQFKLGMVPKKVAHKLISDLLDDARVRESMTNLYDKNGLLLRLNEAVRVCLENPEIPLSLLYADGDGFKEINDKISHGRGDEVIIEMAEALRSCIRKTDPIARLEGGSEVEITLQESRPGGDEFVIVMLGASLEKAQEIGQKIQEVVSKHINEKFPDMEKILGHKFSISVGIVQFDPKLDKELDIAGKPVYSRNLLDRADQKLRHTKSSRGVGRV